MNVSIEQKTVCDYCSAEITRKKRKIMHINICQKPTTAYFCNRDCKLNWIFKKPKNPA